jgi:hypothetical protein
MMTSRPPKKWFWICFISLNQWFITLNILALTKDISFITISCNCSYQHVSLFKESNYKFDNFVNVCWTCMFNVECIVWPSILNVTLPIDAISNVLFLLSLMVGLYYIVVISLELLVLK